MNITIGSLLGNEKEFYLGTAVLITANFEIAPDSVTITVRSPSGIKEVDTASMTMKADTFYEYVYQSVVGDIEGDYIVTVEAISDSYKEVNETTFGLLRQAFQ